MYEEESVAENVVNGAEDLPDDSTVVEVGVGVSNTNDIHGGDVSGGNAGTDISENAADAGESVSGSDAVSNVVGAVVVPDTVYCSCSCGDSAPDLSVLEARTDQVSSLVLLIFLFLVMEWTEKKLTAIVRNMSSRRR